VLSQGAYSLFADVEGRHDHETAAQTSPPPAIALWLQAARPKGRVAEGGTLILRMDALAEILGNLLHLLYQTVRLVAHLLAQLYSYLFSRRP
jgi:hypothetical protein